MDYLKIVVVFFQGIISFFSPCILPILPIYISILSNSSVGSVKDENIKFRNTYLFKNTILFTLGISTTFFILGSSVSFLNKILSSNKDILMFFGGLLIIIMGLFYMGLLRIPYLQREKKFNMEVKNMKPLTAYLLGFTFSFGWTPCIGPILASVLVMASSSESVLSGNILIFVYSMGFIVPFIVIALFYNKLFKILDSIKKNMNIIKAIGGIILIISGAVMMANGAERTYNYFFKDSTPKVQESKEQLEEGSKEEDKDVAPDFTLTDQYGKTHTLSDYKGKTVFLNFWATWCPPCKEEMPSIEKVYKEYGENKGDVIILGATFPEIFKERDEEYITNFLKENNYTFPVVFDSEFELGESYYINAFPTTFIIDKEGNIKHFSPGAMDETTMKQLIESVK
ncbi:cytochrome c biogenesis protein/redoxin [Clostridium cylindrosporum]|uniref:Thiol-disulfide oxidoreductase ResA n=1 Tax=Clostridium cylindrosporum DSM 605 TaxID=1121307 RepID=A0A0J8D7T2_CLOCY|nr:cytochrome c biogenesis protein/redoxin [Clostridium cylindrosporum]KMT22100.1 thiol-disulfide oxidoreductase ResA [Clostridium cylindrosporum DSM 605]